MGALCCAVLLTSCAVTPRAATESTGGQVLCRGMPVDSTVAIAALRLHDSLLPARFDGTVARWLDGVRQRLDPATGLLPHRVDPVTGAPAEVARGTSQSVIHRFLPEIDPAFAREQYLRFRDSFVVSPLRLGPAVREYPLGTDGAGDVDSGPLLLGVSLSATVVTLGAAGVFGFMAVAGTAFADRSRDHHGMHRGHHQDMMTNHFRGLAERSRYMIEIAAEELSEIHLPDPENGYYRGTRFDWSGAISSLTHKGHEYFGEWQKSSDPYLHDRITGPVNEFRTNGKGLGYDEAPAGRDGERADPDHRQEVLHRR